MRSSVTDMYFSTNICVYATTFQQTTFDTELCQEHQALRPESRDGPDLHAVPLLGGRGAEDPRVPRRRHRGLRGVGAAKLANLNEILENFKFCKFLQIF